MFYIIVKYFATKASTACFVHIWEFQVASANFDRKVDELVPVHAFIYCECGRNVGVYAKHMFLNTDIDIAAFD